MPLTQDQIQAINPKDISCHIVDVFKPTDPRYRVREYSHTIYNLYHPTVGHYSINVDTADKLAKKWKKDDMTYNQITLNWLVEAAK